MPNDLLRQPSLAALVTLVWLLVVLALLLQYWNQTAETLLGTDDAMRLVEMRGWLAGQSLLGGWFDLHNTRVQPPLGFDPQWSRLIDAGLAGLLWICRFVEPQNAERLMRAWWPLLWLLPTIAGMVAIASRIGGRDAATASLLFALVGVPGYQQFTPGRIDHHNVQIALTMLVVAATVWSDRKHWSAAAAGALSGLSLAIGFENAPYLAVCGAALALRYVADRDAGWALRDYGCALATGTVAAFLISVGSTRWPVPQCDAIAINGMAAVVCAGLVLALAGWLGHQDGLTRFFSVMGAGAASVAVLLLIEPRCVQGAMALADPAVAPYRGILAPESQPLLSLFRASPLTAAAIAAFPAMALLAAMTLANDVKLRRDYGFLAAAAVFLAAVVTTVLAVRGYSYAIWLGMPLVGAMALRLFAALKLVRLVPRLATALMLTPMAVSAGAITIAYGNGLDDPDLAGPAARRCVQTASYAALARLSPGLIVADMNYGPYLLALTPHSVMAVPYHRAGHGVAAAYRALAAPPDEAQRILREAKANYVMTCGSRPPEGLPEAARAQSLWGRLQAGAVPGWLEPVAGTGPFAVYRMRS
jgi:hypothetical protein